ncbi:MAG: hypothetical protein LOD90_09715 [Symbiobacteriaceae bacterium]
MDEAEVGKVAATKRPVVLVVDDEPRMRELIRLYLAAEFEVQEAGDGLSALRAVRAVEQAGTGGAGAGGQLSASCCSAPCGA